MNASPLSMAEAVLAMRERPDRDFTFADGRGGFRRMAFPELGEHCRRLGAGLLSAGLHAGDRIAIVSREPFDSVRTLFAAFSAGLIPVLVYPPGLLGDNAGYFRHLCAQLESVDAAALLMEAGSRGLLASHLEGSPWRDRVLSLETLRESDPASDFGPGAADPSSVDPSATALLQFTSGSGSFSKAVAVSHASLRANAKAILADGLAIGPSDRAVCWLPLYHDMGLIGHVVSPMLQGLSVTLYPTASFLKRPALWMDAVSRHKGTITFAPNFAFGLAALAKPAPGLDLSALRVLGCGAEPIHANTVRAFVEAYRPFGLDPAAVFPCYGLAEHTLAAAFPAVGEGLRSARVDERAYRESGRAETAQAGAEALEFVSCGKSFPGHAIAILDPKGEAGRKDGEVGEIALRGPSVASGYFRREEETREAFGGGMLRTGDLGFMLEGNLYVTGRKKDLIIVNGRNFDPHHIEHVVEGIAEVRAGSAFAFSVPGPDTERLVILYETRSPDTAAVDQSIRVNVAAQLGVKPFAVAPHPAHSLPKTTSGKKRRRAAREAFMSAANVHV